MNSDPCTISRRGKNDVSTYHTLVIVKTLLSEFTRQLLKKIKFNTRARFDPNTFALEARRANRCAITPGNS